MIYNGNTSRFKIGDAMRKTVELLAPAGNAESLHAAVENGADAVYLGGKFFNARHQADNFDMPELTEGLRYAHARGVSIYLTLNTLVNDEEIPQALTYAEEAYYAGIDGVIVQDLGLAALLRKKLPDLPLHGSTQMTVYDLEGARMLEEMGFSRVVLARELTLEQAAWIARNTGLEVEIFVHGALCVCYSGQCLMSSMIGGRSGNRGRCAQPCRLAYTLAGPGGKGEVRDRPRYLLSPKDMNALEYLPEIVSSGVRSLKIEGRMKSPEYVATVVRIYRKYLDIALDRAGKGDTSKLDIDEKDRRDLLQIFNRGGFSAGYLKGKTGAGMMSYEKPNNSGVCIGSVLSYDRKRRTVKIKLEEALSVGDGIEIWTGGSDSPGGTVTLIKKDGRNSRNAEKGDIVEAGYFSGNITPGRKVFRTTDIEQLKEARKSWSDGYTRRVPVKGAAVLEKGRPPVLTVEDEDGHRVTVLGTIPVETAVNRPLTRERLTEQLKKTGSTPFDFVRLDVGMPDGLTVPVSEINEIRRKALEELYEARADRYPERRLRDNGDSRGNCTGQGTAGTWLFGGGRNVAGKQNTVRKDLQCVMGSDRAECPEAGKPGNASGIGRVGRLDTAGKRPLISLYFCRWDSSREIAGLGADRVYVPVTAVWRPGFRSAAEAARKSGTEVFCWLPSITKGNYEKLIDRFIAEYSGSAGHSGEIDGILAANIGTVHKLMGIEGLRLAGDISLNLFNSYTVAGYAGLGLESAAISVELTLRQISGLAARLCLMDPERCSGQASGMLRDDDNGRPGTSYPLSIDLEAAVYGRLPLMISEYCPVGCVEGGFDAGSECSGCCSRGEYALKDRLGKKFPVMCDNVDCRSIILNSDVLFVPDSVRSLADAGIGIFKLYIWDEDDDTIKGLVKLYRAELAGTGGSDGNAFGWLAEKIKAAGFTKGHYYRGV